MAPSPNDIKNTVLFAISMNDRLRETLVLKGGNAIDLAHGLGQRASIDLDFSIPNDFADRDSFARELLFSFEDAFSGLGLVVFDFKIEPRPDQVSEDLSGFWGGYDVAFKLIERSLDEKMVEDIESRRRHAIRVTALGAKTFTIDISKHEYCEGKEAFDQDGRTIYVYSAAMIAAEKLRAICQQMPEYGPIIHRRRSGTARARDFFDLHSLIGGGHVNPEAEKFHALVRKVFAAKRVPLSLLGKTETVREFHRVDFQSVVETVKSTEVIEDFDFYFEFVCGICRQLKPLWDV